MRSLTGHHDGHGLNELLKLTSDDRDPHIGASHIYEGQVGGRVVLCVQFQTGPREEPASVPGVTDAAVLEVVADRLRGFNEGAFRCRENSIALTKIEEAILWLRKRTEDRASRGVLGTNQP